MTRVLIVEDDPAWRYLLQTLLEINGYEVDLALNGKEALALAGEEPPQLIISDILMPEMDGFTLCRNWKRDPHLRNIPFVFYTATYTDHEDEAFALSLGADKFIPKPTEPEKFLTAIRQILSDYEDGRLTPATLADDAADNTVLQAYNLALARKLEDKMMEMKRANAALRRQHKQLHLLREMDQAISETLALADVLDKLADGLMQLLAVNRCSVWLAEPDGAFLRGREYGLDNPKPDGGQILLPSDHPLVAHLFRSKRPLAIPDVTDPKFAHIIDPKFVEAFDIHAILLVPLIHREEVIGFLVLNDTHAPRSFSPDEIELAESAATQAVVAIEKARLFTAVAQSESRYRDIFEGIRDAILVEDLDGAILDANQSACQMYGYTRAELLSKRVRDLVAPGYPALMSDHLITPDQPFIPIENVSIRANGEQFPVELTATMQKIGGQDVMLVAVRDITARKEANAQMRLQSAALEATANATFITDPNGIILWANRAFTDLTGYPLAEIVGKTPRLLRSGQHDQEFYADMWQTIQAGRVWRGQLVNRCRDGTFYLDEQTITPLLNEQGEITHFIAVKQNVTHREKSAAALAEYAARLEGLHALDQAILQSASPDQLADLALARVEQLIPCASGGVARVDLESGMADVLARCGNTAVFPPAGSPISLSDFDYTVMGAPYTAILLDDVATTSHRSRELERLLEQGIHAFLHVPLLVEGDLIGVLQLGAETPMAFTDTHLQMARELAGQLAIGWHNAALAAEKQRRVQEMEAVIKASLAMRRAKDRADMPPVILDILLDLLQADGAALAMRDVETGGTLIELGWGEWETWTGLRLAAGQGVTGHVIATGRPYTHADVSADSLVVVPELHQGLTAVACVPLITQEMTIGALMIGRKTAVTDDKLRIFNALSDMTANAIQRAALHAETRHHAAELEDRVAARTHQLAQANERLQELDRLKSKFVSDVSHELRTPITNLNLYLDLLKQGDPDQQSRYLQVLQAEANRLGRLVEDILNLSRLDMGKAHPPTLRQLDLNDLVAHVVTANQPRAAARNLTLDFTPAPGLPPVLAEPNQLVQVATNLIANAINYTPTGFIRINTYLDAEGSQICLEVLDSGIGISAEDQKYLFDRFYRGDTVGQLKIPGTGLGLAIAQEIVALHNGSISVESQLGQGSRFLVCLPVYSQEEE